MMIRPTRLSRMRSALVAALLAPLSVSAAQADGTVVVELYTSQGCSSCPAADRMLKTLTSSRPNVIALSLNVDYWDYLGWKDDLALAGNSKRQRAYSKAMRSRHVYTPQMMIDGKMDVVGSRRSDVESMVTSLSSNTDTAKVAASVVGDDLSLTVNPVKQGGNQAVVWLVGYDASITKQIGGGENSGRSIEYTNVVREWREIGRWDGATPATFKSKRPSGQSGFAVIVQEDGIGPIVGATQVRY